MATRVRPKDKLLYEQDFYVWTEVQAGLLRERRFAALDLENLVEEIEALGRAEKREMLGNAMIIVEHLLKLQHSPTQEPRAGWMDSVLEHRNRLDLAPRLRQILTDELPRLYRIARQTAERRLRTRGEDAAAAALPAVCPYNLEQITTDWWP